jgi:hypothetical protein
MSYGTTTKVNIILLQVMTRRISGKPDVSGDGFACVFRSKTTLDLGA